MVLELQNGKKLSDPNETQVETALRELDGLTYTAMVLRLSSGHTLRVIRDRLPRFYFVQEGGLRPMQTLDPVSEHLAIKTIRLYMQGDKGWKHLHRWEKVNFDTDRRLRPGDIEEPLPLKQWPLSKKVIALTATFLMLVFFLAAPIKKTQTSLIDVLLGETPLGIRFIVVIGIALITVASIYVLSGKEDSH